MTLFTAPHELHKHQVSPLETSRPHSLSGCCLDQVRSPLLPPTVSSSCGLLLRQTNRQTYTHMALWPLHPLAGSGVIFAAADTLGQWVHILQLLAPQTHRPSNPWSGSCWCAQSPIHTCTQNRESLTQERVRKAFNKKIGQTAFFKAWPHKHTHKQLFMLQALSMPLFILFSHTSSNHLNCPLFLPLVPPLNIP